MRMIPSFHRAAQRLCAASLFEKPYLIALGFSASLFFAFSPQIFQKSGKEK